jgi:replicative DNA helicase
VSAVVGYSDAALAHFEAHAIEPAVAAEVGVREAGGALAYPCSDDAGAFERRRSLNGSGPKTTQPQGRSLTCWWPAGRSGRTVLVCEGESDALAALSAIRGAGELHPAAAELLGELAVCAVPGASFPADRLAAALEGFERVILAPDADDAGDVFATRAAEALSAVSIDCVRLPLPDGTDLAERLVAAADRADALAQAIADAEPLTDRAAEQAPADGHARALTGAQFALDVPTEVPAMWGSGSRVLAAEGEPTMIVKPDGVGGTTIAQQFVLARTGIRAPIVLGLPVAVDERRLLYLALDRPRQAARSFRRMVTEDDREALERQLVAWPGALPFDVVAEPARLLAFAREHGAGTIVIDCLKDLAPALSDEATGQAVNVAMQACVAAGVEVLALHHQRKAQAENKRPRRLADVYGSRWLTAGCGSVLMLWGEPGDPVVELTHLKQPADEVGPLTLQHDNQAGTTAVLGASDVVDILGESGMPLTAKDVARRLLQVPEPDRNGVAKAKRRLTAAVAEGRAERVEPAPGEPALWTIAGGCTQGVHGGCTEGVHARGARSAPLKGGRVHPLHDEVHGGCTEPDDDGALFDDFGDPR